MDDRPIGVFDSGLGGLTAVRAMDILLPGESVVYLGDTQRVPYGGRSVSAITRFALDDLACLMKYDVKAVVVACGTVSTVALDAVRKAVGDIPVYGVVEGAAIKAANVTENKRIGVIGTVASVRSGAYERTIKEILPSAEVISVPCPLFVPLVEAGRIKPGDPVIETIAQEYLEPIRRKGVDTLVLGCTHYPHLSQVISGIMGRKTTLINVGEEAVRRLAGDLREKDLICSRISGGSHRYLVSDGSDSFSELASFFLQREICGEVETVSFGA